MCGVVGIVESVDRPVNRFWLTAMNAALSHRGPDEDGFYSNGSVWAWAGAVRQLLTSTADVKGRLRERRWKCSGKSNGHL